MAGHLFINNGILGWTLGSETGLMGPYTFDSVTVDVNSGVYIAPGVSFSLLTSALTYPLRVAGTAVFSSATVSIESTGKFIADHNNSISLTNLVLKNGSQMYHTSNGTAQTKGLTLNLSGNFTMEAGSLIDVTGRGFQADAGLGRGVAPTGTQAGGGAGYGGIGGCPATGCLGGGSVYGSATNPISIGSGGTSGGGGVCSAGSGGGLVRVSVGGIFDFSGTIRANGGSSVNTSCVYGAGGGSGGSVNIATNTWTGTGGIIEAKGGDAAVATNRGGSGGGGRVRLSHTADTYSGAVTYDINGGISSTPDRMGAAGTLSIN